MVYRVWYLRRGFEPAEAGISKAEFHRRYQAVRELTADSPRQAFSLMQEDVLSDEQKAGLKRLIGRVSMSLGDCLGWNGERYLLQAQGLLPLGFSRASATPAQSETLRGDNSVPVEESSSEALRKEAAINGKPAEIVAVIVGLTDSEAQGLERIAEGLNLPVDQVCRIVLLRWLYQKPQLGS
ncbi:MAG: hypothetical protein PHO89_11725 [Methylacidiphilaceae bacterium]|nr:hypothetical protein [Candidatus Methylacidiphilaceae bacterium]